MMEPIQGEAGVVVPDPGYLRVLNFIISEEMNYSFLYLIINRVYETFAQKITFSGSPMKCKQGWVVRENV